MKNYIRNPEKNQKLIRERNISFEEIVFHIRNGDEVDVFEHPDQEHYQGQKVSAVIIDSYAYLVPFAETETEIFLKTAFPSRKATKKYLGGRQ